MILTRTPHADGSVSFDGAGFHLTNMHAQSRDCFEFGCVVHAPSDTVQNREHWQFNWREDRGLMERICRHGIGHPDFDVARRNERIGRPEDNVHACCGCGCAS